MTSSGRNAYATKLILSERATKIVFMITIKRLLSKIDSSAVETRNKLFDALVKPVLLYGCEIWGPELLSYKTHFEESTIEQVHIKFSKQTLNVPWYTENKACRAELGRYPLSIDIKASLLCYWQRLEQKSDNALLNEAFFYARNHSQFYDLLNSDETIQMHYKIEVIKNQQCVKQQLQKNFLKIGLKLKTTFRLSLDKNIQTRKLKKIIA